MNEKPCGCCEGTEALTPEPTANRPGLDKISYRVGTHATFLETMKARLSNLCLGDEKACQKGDGPYPLQKLTTREASDPAIALLDSWATVADVLTFYQERLANEHYLRTATERRSILELARLVGYKLRPGVSASTFLAFTLEDGHEVKIPAGTRAQSLPGPGELPQPFETSEPLMAKAVWNATQPRQSQLQVMEEATHTVYLRGVQANLKPNDPVLVVGTTAEEEPEPYLRRVHKVEIEAADETTRVLLRGELHLADLDQLSRTTLFKEKLASPVDPMPADGGMSEFSNPILSWRGSETVSGLQVRYRVLVADPDDPDAPIIDEADIEDAFYRVPDGTLEPETTYRWSATAVDGCREAPSEVWTFTTGDQEDDEQTPPDPLMPPTPPLSPDPVVGAWANRIETLVRRTLDSILGDLKNPNLSTAELRARIAIEGPVLEDAAQALSALDAIEGSNLDLCALIAWVRRIAEGLTAVSHQLDLRRGVLGASERLYKGSFIDPRSIFKLIQYLPDRPGGPYSSYPSLEEFATATVEAEVPTGIRGLLEILRDDTVVEDEKIQAVKVQRNRLAVLWSIFDVLHEQPDNNFDDIKAWIGTPTAAPEDSWIGLLDGMITDEPSADPLPRLTELLLKPPSRPPLNAFRLERTVTGTFAEGADVAPRMLTTLQRELKDTLYEAWAETEVSPTSPTQGFEALRVKAAPFGAKAAPIPIYDDDGVIIGHEEWPLFELSVSMVFGEFSQPFQVRLTLTWEAEERQETVALNTPYDSAELTLLGIPIYLVTVFGFTLILVGEVLLDKAHILFCAGGFGEPMDLWIGTAADEKASIEGMDVDDSQVIPVYGNPVAISYDRDAATSTWILTVDGLRLPAPPQQRRILTLDGEYDKIAAGSWVVIEWPAAQLPAPSLGPMLIRRVEKVETISKANYGKVTRLTLNEDWLGDTDTSFSLLRGASVYAQSEPLELGEEPIEIDVQGDTIRLGGLYGGLEVGRWLIVSGERTDIPGTRGLRTSELAMLSGVRHTVQQIQVNGEIVDLRGDRIHTTIQLAKDLAYRYKRDTVTVAGNVVKATHGESRREVLGSGDGNLPRQTFALKQSPLTHLAAATPAGAESTLEVRINDILWHEEDNLIWLDPNDRGYVTLTDNEDVTAVIFGDGLHGARLPTGMENVRAVYRTGIGRAGNVDGGQISLLSTRPLGVKGVINPLPATGGADRENQDQARRNTPTALMALDRLVSLQDYADFARSFAGISKASACRLSDGRRELVHLTIAGLDDIPIGEDSDLYHYLRQALYQFGSPDPPVDVAHRELMLLVLSANVRLLADYQWESVAPQIRATLLEAFGFESRQLGQDVLLSEVLSVIQRVPGVAYVDVDILDSVTENTPFKELEKLGSVLERKQRVDVKMARVQTAHIVERPSETLSTIAQRYGISEIELWELNQEQGIEDPDDLTGIKQLSLPHRIIRPAQLAYLSPEVPDTLILQEVS